MYGIPLYTSTLNRCIGATPNFKKIPKKKTEVKNVLPHNNFVLSRKIFFKYCNTNQSPIPNVKNILI